VSHWSRLAGELATASPIVPWEKGAALNAAVAIFKIWRAAQPQSARGKEHTQIIERIVDFVDRHGNARFCDIDAPNIDLRLLHNQAGYWEDAWENSDNGDGKEKKTLVGRTYLFTSGGLKEAIGNFGVTRALEALSAAWAFTDVGAKEKAKLRRVPQGGSKKLYHIDIGKLRGE
jgi:putative DNA primase/helicase